MDFPIKKFLSYYQPYLKQFFSILACALLASTLALAFPLLVRYITKDFLTGSYSAGLDQIYWVGGLMLALVIVQNLIYFYVDYKGHELGARMETDMRSELFAHMQSLPFNFFDKEKTGQLMSRITNDLLLLSELYHHGPEDYLKYSVRFFGAFVILFHINAALTIVVFCFTPVLAICAFLFNKVVNKALRNNKERIAEVNAQVEDSLAGIRTVKSFVNEQEEILKFNQKNSSFFESRKNTYKAEATFYNIFQVLLQLITVTVVVIGSAKITNETLDLADLLTFLLYINFMIEPVSHLAHMSTQLQEGITGFQRFMEIMKTKPEAETQSLPRAVIAGKVEFRHISFRYEDRLHNVFENLSLCIQPGEYVALVGMSGIGKTSLCSLIPRFYDVSEGKVLVDNMDVRDYKLDYLRRSIGIVQQDVYLFTGTILDNIRYGKPAATIDEIIIAAKHADAHDFIMNLPNGYHSEIGQRGIKLSGGQKQRLSIARVFLKNPSILIFDEATSALDNASEAVVKKSLEALTKNRTTIVIAHRLSSIRNADRIIILNKDGILEEGSHDKLIRNNGSYAQLYSRQFDLN